MTDTTMPRYAATTIVDLSAQAAGSYTFSAWSGDCSGSTAAASTTMNANKTCTAAFVNLLANARSSLMGSGLVPSQVDSGAVNPGGTSPQVSVSKTLPGALRFLLDWPGSTLKLSVYQPGGALYSEAQGSSPPLTISVPNAATGTWKYQVTGVSVPYSSYPYALGAGIEGVRFFLPFLPKSDSGVSTAADPSASTINFIVQNLSTESGSFFTGFRRISDGAQVFTSDLQSLEPGRSAPVIPSGLSGLGSGSYSVVLTSTHSLGVVANGHAGNGSAYSYTAAPTYSTTIYFPNLSRNLGPEQWNTPFFIQNADTTTASDLAVRFYKVPEGTLLKELTGLPLSPGQSRRFNPAQEAGLSDGVIFSVVASAGAKLAGMAYQYSASDGGKQLLASSAFSSGGSTVYLPNLSTYLGPQRWTTPFLIQNIGGTATDLTIQYFHVPSGALHKTVASNGLLPGRSYVGQPHHESGLVEGGVYSAVVTSSGQPIVGLIQQHGDQGQALNHNAFNGGSTRAYCPNLSTNLGPEQWNTPLIIQNVGTVSTNLTISYYRSGAGTLDKVVAVSGLQPGRAHVALPHHEPGLTPNSGYSAVIESSGQPVVALVNQHGVQSGDQNLGNECLNS